ncbi:MAG: PIN domain-containing protein [Micrococcales bacterium]|nr:PIN domain-containing protein [Micrococcales bacterium]
MSTLLDTNVIVRHLTQDPPTMGRDATAYLSQATSLVLTDVIAAETVYVLQSFYQAPRPTTAAALRALVAMESVVCEHPSLILRALDLYSDDRMDFADAYLVAYAENTQTPEIASFDKGIDKARTVTRVDPSAASRREE